MQEQQIRDYEERQLLLRMRQQEELDRKRLAIDQEKKLHEVCRLSVSCLLLCTVLMPSYDVLTCQKAPVLCKYANSCIKPRMPPTPNRFVDATHSSPAAVLL